MSYDTTSQTTLWTWRCEDCGRTYYGTELATKVDEVTEIGIMHCPYCGSGDLHQHPLQGDVVLTKEAPDDPSP
jgi:NAD-dependent SIR2 family protein deacetylase